MRLYAILFWIFVKTGSASFISYKECPDLFKNLNKPESMSFLFDIEALSAGGWDNSGIYRVKELAHDENTPPYIAKTTNYPNDIDILAQKAQVLSVLKFKDGKTLGPKVIGISQIGEHQKPTLVMEEVPGFSSKDKVSAKYISTETLKEAEEAIDLLLDHKILPFDFQFMVNEKGEIKIIDADLYESLGTLRTDHPYTTETARKRSYRFLKKMATPENSDMIVGKDVYSELPFELKKKVNQLLEKISSRTQKILADIEEEPFQQAASFFKKPPAKAHFADLPPVIYSPMSERVKSLIQNHPIFTKYKNEWAHYKKQSTRLKLEMNLQSTDQINGAPIPTGAFGENIQLKFLQSILDHLTQDSKTSKNLEKRIPVSIADSGEKSLTDDYTYPHLHPDFDMPDLKAANIQDLNGLEKFDLRNILGIPKKSKVLSFYGYRHIGNAGGDGARRVRESFNQLSHNLKSDENIILFVSDGGALLKKLPDSMISKWGELFPNKPEIKALSQVNPEDLKKNIIIINDLPGRLPYLHKVADLSIINGPINFFEALNVKTPTLVSNDIGGIAKERRGYDSEVYQSLLKQGLASGARVFKDSNQVVNHFNGIDVIPSPDLNSSDAIIKVLNQLENFLIDRKIIGGS